MKLRCSAMLVGVLGAFAATAAAAAEITLYEHAQFDGRRMTLRGALDNLDHTSASSVTFAAASGSFAVSSAAIIR